MVLSRANSRAARRRIMLDLVMSKAWIRIAMAAAVCAAAAVFAQQEQKRDGFKDTNLIPGQKWHQHDPDRPYPREVTPGAAPGAPPSDAEVLFNGKDLSKWQQRGRGVDRGKMVDAKWKVVDGTVEVVHNTGDLLSRDKFGDCQIHVEWQEPAGIQGYSQERGNSGVYIMSRYELQVLDSYRAPTYADGQAGAIYGQFPPLVNPARPPGEWQTYDVIFEAPRWEGDKLAKPAYITLTFNGVVVQNHQALNGPTEYKVALPYKKHDPEEPLLLQDHASSRPVRYRNIWVRKLGAYDQP
jgi:hypothetical protein